MRNEIFRHLRPQHCNTDRKTLDTGRLGGISFLFLPSDEGTEYNYWIYVCPSNTIFSTKTAIRHLREAVSRRIKPWGSVKPQEQSILHAGIKSILSEETDLPSEAAQHAFKIMMNNFRAAAELDALLESVSRTRTFYE
jgi:hypothetical protein